MLLTMAYGRGVVLGVAGVVLLTALVSGPLVPGVTLTAETDQTAYGVGNATVTDVELPRTATIERASYGAENYHLTVPPATVRFANIAGQPTLSYRLTVEVLDYVRTTTTFLDESNVPSYRLSMRSDTFSLDEISKTEYDARVSVVKRDSAGEAIVGARNITIRVEE